MKKCTKCGILLPLTNFHKDPHVKSGIRAACKVCRKKEHTTWYILNKDRVKAWTLKWHAANPEKVRISQRKSELKKKFGLSWDTYNSMILKQDNKCSICLKSMDGFRNCNVDHDHKTGLIRDLLCSHCNRMLGSALEDQLTLQRAIDYLKKWKT